jgi:hypothetical protein
LAIIVRFFLPWRTNSAMIQWGDPTPMNPPIMMDAPSGIMATASAQLMNLFMCISESDRSYPLQSQNFPHILGCCDIPVELVREPHDLFH